MSALNIDTATEFFVYRWYDADDVLLYIGVTYDLKTRERAHRQTAEWYRFACRFTSETIEGGLGEAMRVEADAIRGEKSVFNHTDADDDAGQRRAAYLAAHPVPVEEPKEKRRTGPRVTGDRRNHGVRIPLNDDEKLRVNEWANGSGQRIATFMRDALMREVEAWERAERRRQRTPPAPTE